MVLDIALTSNRIKCLINFSFILIRVIECFFMNAEIKYCKMWKEGKSNINNIENINNLI